MINLEKLPSLIRHANRLDYVLAVICLGIGIWWNSYWWYAFAVISLVSAIYNPADKFYNWVIRRLTTRVRSH